MTMKFAETVRKAMGWCPEMASAHSRGEFRLSDRKGPVPDAGNPYVVEGVIVDYQSKGLPIPLFIGLVVALSVAIQYVFATYRTVAASIGSIVLLLFIAFVIYATVIKSRVAITGGAITLYRPLRNPDIIPLQSVVTIEVKENTVPLSPKVIGVVAFIILALCIEPVYTTISGGLLHADPVRVVFGIGVPLVLVALLYRAYSRAVYAKTVVLTMTAKKIVAIFTDDPGEITALLEAS
jgi:hypothetical protein